MTSAMMLITLTALVAFTTALFSRVYMRVEQDRGKLSAGRLRLYHAMYQMFVFTMLLALTANNVGILWVALEGATLSTVLLVSLYRTPASLEAAWKYFILCGVGIAVALFGTIVRRERMDERRVDERVDIEVEVRYRTIQEFLAARPGDNASRGLITLVS